MKRARQYFSDFNKFCLPVLSAFYSTPHPIGKCSAGNIGKQHSKWKCMNQNQTPTPPSEYAVSESPSVWPPGEKMNQIHRIQCAENKIVLSRQTNTSKRHRSKSRSSSVRNQHKMRGEKVRPAITTLSGIEAKQPHRTSTLVSTKISRK